MLVTTCRHCHARFRVTPDQLNLRQGQVRCGQCHAVFNGFEALERFPGDDTGARLLALRAAKGAPQGTSPAPPTPPAAAPAAMPVAGERALPTTAMPDSVPPDLRDLADLPDVPDLADLPDVPDLLLESEVPRDEPPGEPVKAPDEAPAEAPPRPSASKTALRAAATEDFAQPAPPARPSRAWAFGALLLALILALQVVYAFRARLAQQYPVLRPILESACARAGCTVPWVNDESALKLEDSELLEVPGKPGQIALQARVRNLSATAQEFPHLELTLTDASGQTAVRRVLRPADYLGHAPIVGEVMAAGSEALLSVRLETGNVRPTGYELLLFYP
jgi:predicted Zn finger-like uncharacterized protein